MTALLSVLNSAPDWGDGDLSKDGETFEHLGRVFRLRVESDETGLDMWSDDCYGLIETYSHDYNHDAHAPRPDNMDGSAEKLQFGRGEWMWWQTPKDVPRGSDGYRKLRALVRDVLEFGFYSVGLELLRGEDAYHRPIVANAAWLGGLEPLGYDVWSEMLASDVLSELYAELLG